MGRMLEGGFGRSDGSDQLSNEYLSETTTVSDESSNVLYRIPTRVSVRLANPTIVSPVCCEIIAHLMDIDMDYTERRQMIENTLKTFVEGLEYEHFYTSIVDFLIWTRALDSFFYRRGIDKNNIGWITREFLRFVDKNAQNNRDSAKLRSIISDQVDHRQNCFTDLFEAVFMTKAYEEFKCSLCSQHVYKCYAKFLFNKISVDPGRVFVWIQKMELYKCIAHIPFEQLVYYALIGKETGQLLELCQADQSKKLAIGIVAYLDKIAGASFQFVDPEYIPLDPSPESVELFRREKEIINMALNYRKRFQLEISTVKNCIFVRQMKAFLSAFRDYDNSESRKDHDAFYEKTFHIMQEGGTRAQHAILTYLYIHSSPEDALAMALKMNIPEKGWPPKLNFSEQAIETAKKQTAERDEAARKEQLKIKDGFSLLNNGKNIVRMVDSEEAIDNLLKPFIENTENEYFGFDAEWDMSFSGEMGTLCLIQMTSESQTMLIDVHSFRKVHQWSDARFLDLFKLIFGHSKKVYGFALDSDLKIIAFNFPVFGKEILPKLENLVCLQVAVKIIRGDIDLCKAVFGDNPPDDLNLSALTRRMLCFSLDKVEQSSVWSYRPLRFKQQMYAAKDSHATVELTKRFINLINEKCPEKMDSAFIPWIKTQVTDAVDPNLPINAVKRKTKSSHFKEDELKEVIKFVNNKLATDQFTDLSELLYITDTMCDPLGGCLRRIGISVRPGSCEADVVEQAKKFDTAKILTAGKACKKYPFDGRVINVNSSLSLEHQLSWFLFEERVCIDPESITPRCVKCNGDHMIYMPAVCIRYLHYQMAILKSIDVGINTSNLTELENTMKALDPRVHSQNYCIISKGEWGLTAMLPDAIVYFDNIRMQQRTHGIVINPQNSIKLQLAMHLLGSEYDQNRLHALCFNCGKENVECSIPL